MPVIMTPSNYDIILSLKSLMHLTFQGELLSLIPIPVVTSENGNHREAH